MDNADVRRGNPTVHKRWDANTAILSGDVMLSLADVYMSRVDDVYLRDVMSVFHRTSIEIAEGQQYDMDFETRDDVAEAEYIEMIRLKTSVLLACALKLGAILADAPQQDADALYAFGEKMGLAFQLQDDYLDVYGDFKVFGKKIGGDILCNKKTFMLINALAKADPEKREELDRWLAATDYVPEEKVKAVTHIYNELDIPQLALDKINAYFEEAKTALESVQVADEKKHYLWELAEQMLGRQS
jgi:geranylgeranyl diphosphate synthase type II